MTDDEDGFKFKRQTVTTPGLYRQISLAFLSLKLEVHLITLKLS